MEEPECPLTEMCFGTQQDRYTYSTTNNLQFPELAKEFMNERPEAYWALYRSDDQFPLEFGPYATRFENRLDEKESLQLYINAAEKYNVKSPIILIYFQRPSAIQRTQYANRFLSRSKEEEIMNKLIEKGLG